MITLNPRTCVPVFLAALVLARPAAAELPVTTSETDSGLPEDYVIIVEPADGAVLPGNPDALVPVVLEYEIYFGDLPSLRLDDVQVGVCPGDGFSPCMLDVTIPPGVHTLTATIGLDEHTISVEVQPTSDTTGGETDTGGSTTDNGSSGGNTDGSSSQGNPTTSGSSGATGPDPGSSSGSAGTDAGTTSDGAATSGGGDGDKGCACSTGRGAPDVLGLALVALALPWRRRRNR